MENDMTKTEAKVQALEYVLHISRWSHHAVAFQYFLSLFTVMCPLGSWMRFGILSAYVCVSETLTPHPWHHLGGEDVPTLAKHSANHPEGAVHGK